MKQFLGYFLVFAVVALMTLQVLSEERRPYGY